MRPYTEVVSAKKILNANLGPIGSLDSPVIKQIAQLSNPYSEFFRSLGSLWSAPQFFFKKTPHFLKYAENFGVEKW